MEAREINIASKENSEACLEKKKKKRTVRDLKNLKTKHLSISLLCMEPKKMTSVCQTAVGLSKSIRLSNTLRIHKIQSQTQCQEQMN